MPHDDHDLDVERRLSAVETKIDVLSRRDAEILAALKEVQRSNQAVLTKFDQYRAGGRVVMWLGAVAIGAATFLGQSQVQTILKRLLQ